MFWLSRGSAAETCADSVSRSGAGAPGGTAAVGGAAAGCAGFVAVGACSAVRFLDIGQKNHPAPARVIRMTTTAAAISGSTEGRPRSAAAALGCGVSGCGGAAGAVADATAAPLAPGAA